MSFLIKSYRLLITIAKYFQPLLLFAIRIFWGSLLAYGGLSKLEDITKVSQYFDSIHIYFPHFNAYAVALTEFIGGILLIFGLGTRFAALAISIIMLVAMIVAHHVSWSSFIDPNTLIQQSPFTFLIAALTLFAFGPGLISVDALIKRKITGS